MYIPKHNLVFNMKGKGVVTQGFDQNATDIYKKDGRTGHGAIDTYVGYGKPIKASNAGQVYKVISPGDLASNWVGVYMLCETEEKDVYMEIGTGHFSKVAVKENQMVKEGDVLGYEGNSGKVFSGSAGRFITVAEQLAGDKRGAHTHTWWRPVRLSEKKPTHRLRTKSGASYRWSDGRYLEIINVDNGYKGNIDPQPFLVNRDYKTGVIKTAYQKLVEQLKTELTLQLIKVEIAKILKKQGKDLA